MTSMEPMAPSYRAEPLTDDSPAPLAPIAPAIATAVTLLEAVIIGCLIYATPALCGNSCNNDAYRTHYASALRLAAGALVIPVGLLVTSWALPWRRRFNGARFSAAFMTPVSLGVLYFLFILFTALP
jgi:hypothetical protein